VPLETVEAEGVAAASRMIPMNDLLEDVPAARLTERGAQRAGHGNAVGPGDLEGPAPALPGGRIRLLDPGRDGCSGWPNPGRAGFCSPSSCWCKILSHLELADTAAWCGGMSPADGLGRAWRNFRGIQQGSQD
jgi:hypothetical protein